ncbi:sucrose-6-phosphate hydrolase [Sutcliffiella horikoshii]|uniref:Sucrose-6-phosphate hydrolase n=1 Tax=Sutcliffiella horikoshii TaxID=79883 RepID=A0A5D4T477_9BACI|nr:sucrose-6-phosphate hydrolase [Sutcliffiella horikoshii]TYS70135.1 sucrose-6-phosphate hydrolase [Sutcliffiella horikoshii]
MTEREQELIRLAEEEVEKNKEVVEGDPYRLRYHLMPPVGLLNDPNGFIQWNGTYHLFYQWMPFKTGHGAKFWGHYSSEDLMNWKHEPIALAPSEWFEKNGCYSGSAVEHDGKMVLFYTGNVKDADGNRETYQCMAVSEDGVTFDKKGPVVELPEGYTAHFRDPKVWKKGADWYMVVGAQSEDLTGKVALLKSSDLKEWQHLGAIAGSGMNGLGEFGYMWECPDLFELDGVDVLVASPQGLEADGMKYQNVYQAGYFVGELDYESGVFEHGDFIELDRGFEFYAPQTTLDEQGRRLMVGWMGVPEQDEDKHPTIAHKWVHALTLPRELKWVDGKLLQVPVEELTLMRKDQLVEQSDLQLSDDGLGLVIGGSKAFEMSLFLEKAVATFEMALSDTVQLTFDASESVFSLRRKSFVTGEWETRSCSLQALTELRAYVDTSSIEVFLNGGEEVFTARIFPDGTAHERITLSGVGKIGELRVWELEG